MSSDDKDNEKKIQDLFDEHEEYIKKCAEIVMLEQEVFMVRTRTFMQLLKEYCEDEK
jgi:hypothetical protein